VSLRGRPSPAQVFDARAVAGTPDARRGASGSFGTWPRKRRAPYDFVSDRRTP
jgi:hypothetical protein